MFLSTCNWIWLVSGVLAVYESSYWEHLCTNLYVDVFSFLLGKHLGIDMLGNMVGVCLAG